MNVGADVQQVVTASAAASGPGTGFKFQIGPSALVTVVVQSAAALASFHVDGRISPEAPWVNLTAPNTALAGGAGAASEVTVGAMTELRLDWLGNAGTINAWIMA